MKYVNWIDKTGVVEAEQWEADIESQDRIDLLLQQKTKIHNNDPDILIITNSAGTEIEVSIDEWVVTDSDGGLYIMEDEYFNKYYLTQSQ